MDEQDPEIQPPDRYNDLGEWKPLVSAVGSQEHLSEIAAITDDEEVQAVLLYVRVTSKQLIEFVACTSVELPAEQILVENGINLWACPRLTDSQFAFKNVHVYDGWASLASLDPSYIRERIDQIERILNRIAFAFQATVEWRMKYLLSSSLRGYATPYESDMQLLDMLFASSSSPQEERILDIAIDWHGLGRSSGNPFVEFLCYYIAIESISIAVTDGEADFGLGYSEVQRDQLNDERKNCIWELYEQQYSSDPIRFIANAYFECVVGLKRRTRDVVQRVFGHNHPYISQLFEREDGASLSDIRSDLAHGRIAQVNPEDERMVREKLPDISEISYEFLLRVIHRSREDPPDVIPSWSRLHALEMSSSDPRSFLLTTDESALQDVDWRIRPEWCGRS